MFSRKLTLAVTVVVVALVTIGLVASALPVFAGTASALPMHAQLISTSPEDGASVKTAEKVVLTFSEDVNEQFLQVRVEGPGGHEVEGKPTVDGSVVTQPLVAGLPAGEHAVTFRVVSVDGHPVSGTFTFTTTVAGASATPTATASATPSETPTPSAGETPTPSPSPSQDATEAASTSGTSWLLPVVLGLLLLLLVGGGVLLARGGRSSDDEAPTDDA